VSTSASYTFTASSSVTVVANFSAIPAYAISASSSPTAGGSTGGGGTYASGSTVTVTATPDSCYRLGSGRSNGAIVSTSCQLHVTATASETVVANFLIANFYTVTTSSSPSAGGTTSGGTSGGGRYCPAATTVTSNSHARLGLFLCQLDAERDGGEHFSKLYVHRNASIALVANFTTVIITSPPVASKRTGCCPWRHRVKAGQTIGFFSRALPMLTGTRSVVCGTLAMGGTSTDCKPTHCLRTAVRTMSP